MQRSVLALALLCGSSGASLAQSLEEQDLALAYGDRATVSIATGAPQTLRRAPAVASVITAEDMRAMGATDLEDVLERVPGLHVSRNSQLYNPLLVMRGIYSQYNQQILVLFNGLPMTTMQRSDRGSKGWRGIPVENIARIEVMRGPGSALYGADAYSGVVNIVSKSAADLAGSEAGARVGSFGERDAWVQGVHKREGLELLTYLRAGRSEGFNTVIEKDAQTTNDAAFGSHVSLAPGPLNVARDLYDLGLDLAMSRWRLRASYQWRELETGIGVGQALDPNGLVRTKRLMTDLSWTEPQLTPELGAGVSLSQHSYVQQILVPLNIFPAGAVFPTGTFTQPMLGAPENSERQLRLSGYLTYSGWRDHQWRLGAGADDLDMYRTAEGKNFSYAPNGLPIPLASYTDHSDTDPFLRPHRRRVYNVYLQDSWTLAPDWNLTAGVRHDHFSDVGGTTNPRLALVWDAAYNLTFKLMSGQAFRAPGFAELHAITNPVARGNPQLRPETIRMQEAAVLWQARRELQLGLNLFSYRMHDIIRTLPNTVPGTGTTFSNSGDQSGHGFELEAGWEPDPALRLQASLSQQRARDDGNGSDPGYAPQRRFYVHAEWRPLPGWQLGAQLNRVSGRVRALGDLRPPVADYTGLDLSLRYAPATERWSLALVMRNATDSDQREPSLAPGRIVNDLPQAPRAVSLEASYRF